MNKKISIYVSVLVLLLFVALTMLVLSGAAATWNDSIHHYITLQRNSALTNVMIFLDVVGSLYGYIPLIILLLIFHKTRRSIGIPVGVVILISESLNRILKPIFAIPRPDVDSLVTMSGYGHPSGHAMNALVFGGTCIMLVFGSNYKKQLKIALFALSFAYIIIMGFSRIYLGVHTATDVMAGYLAGVFILSVNYYLCIVK